MSQILYDCEKTAKKRVYYTGTDTMREGYNLCYDVDFAGAVATEGKTGDATVFNQLRASRVEKPSVGNQEHYSGVVAPGDDRKVGPCYIDVLVPTHRGQKVKVWTEENCTIDATYLTLKAGSYAAGGVGEGRVIAKAMQTVDRSSTNGTVQAQLGGPLQTSDTYNTLSRTTVQLPTAAIWDNFPLDELRKNPSQGTLLDIDFKKHGDFPTRQFTTDTTASITPSTLQIGEMVLFSSADNEEASCQWDVPIKVSGGTKWGFEARIKVEVLTDDYAFCMLGLQASHVLAGDEMVDNGAAMADLHYLGLALFGADGDVFDFQYIETGSTDNVHDDDYIVPVANTYFTFGMYFNGTTIQGYVDGVAVGTAISATDIAAADFPTAEILVPMMAVKGGNAADFDFTIDWLRVAQL